MYDAISLGTPRAAFAPSRLDRALHDRDDLALRERLKIHLGAARADRRIDLFGIARRRADQNEIGRRAFFKEPAHVRGHVRSAVVVVRRLERHAAVLEHFEQPPLQRGIHLADLVDEQHAAVGLGHEAEFRFGNAGLGKLAAAALIDRIVHAAEQRIDGFARIPAHRRSAGLDERRVLGERRMRARLRSFQREPRDRRLADARRPVQNHVLRIRRANLGHQRFDRGFLADDLAQRLRAQLLQRRRSQTALRERFEFFEFGLRRGRLGTAAFAQRLELEILEILLMPLGHALVHALVDRGFRVTLREQVRHRIFDFAENLALLGARGRALERRIFENETLQRAQPVGQILRAHHLERAHFSGPQNDLVGAEYASEHLVERGDVPA